MARDTATDEDNPLNPERAISIRQVSELIGDAVITIRQKMARGDDLPPYFRCGRSVRWRLGDVLDWRNARTCGKRVSK